MENFFNNLSLFLEDQVAKIANQLDEDSALLKKTYESFTELGSLNLLIPSAYGGLGGEREEWIELNILLAQYSGALLFLQGQHQLSISRLKKLLPNKRIEEAFHFFSTNQQGIALALKKPNYFFETKKNDDGYRITGKLPWVTGFGFFSHLFFSFEYEGMVFYTLLPFENKSHAEGSLTISPKIETAVFNSTNNNSLIFDQWLITEDQIIASHPITTKKPEVHPSAYSFAGTSKALLKEALQGKYKDLPEVKEKHTLLQEKWNLYYQRILENTTSPFKLRAEGLELAEECEFFCRAVCGSLSALRSHPITRLSREIWQYTVAGYSENQVRGYLEQISNNLK